MIRYALQFNSTSEVIRRGIILVLIIALCTGVFNSYVFNHYFGDDPQGFADRAYTIGAIAGAIISMPIVFAFFFAAKHIYGAHKQVEKIAREDFLTGLLNRREFFAQIASQDKSGGQPPTVTRDGMLLIIDADNFKRINDNHGHLSGDKALIAIANAIGSAVRSVDIVSRIGGEEFAVLVSDGSHEIGAEIATQILLGVNSVNLKLDSEVLALSVSIGAVRVFHGLSLSVAMKAADAALYRAKHSGKNMVVFGGVADGVGSHGKSLSAPQDEASAVGTKVA